MKSSFLTCILVGISFLACNTQAQERPLSLDQLLQQVRAAATEDRSEQQARIERFVQQRDEQAARLAALKQKVADAREQSKHLEQRFEDNQESLTELRQTRDEALGDLQELFGVLANSAGQIRATLKDSPTHLQFPERDAFLAGFISSLETNSGLPDVKDIRRFWLELHQELAASGQARSFDAEVTSLSGATEAKQVTRFGTFNVVSEGQYLQYLPASTTLTELAQQPGRQYQVPENPEDASQPVTVSLDPTRGQLLDMLLQVPDLSERIRQGGVVGYVILALGAIGLLLALERLVILGLMSGRVNRQARNPGTPGSNPLGRILNAAREMRRTDPESLEVAMGEALLRERPAIHRGLALMKIIATVAPLLGLLGTVVGMILTFQSITLFGNGDPKMMAGGISQALVTTVLGLATAIPVLLMHTLVSARARSIWQVLEEQAAGIIAENFRAADKAPRIDREPVPATQPELATS
ncbi:MotA/TolQ/ExbB proton channel family protein [Marinobacter sp. HN1S83]|uniref:MotA/TolQ/ExbB proton channel family protein n=1 Tax=Marinobacter sp. HN1S83 TaxID=3382301 RepID=UPI00387B3E66